MKKQYSLLFLFLASIYTFTRLLKHYPDYLPYSWLMKMLPLMVLIAATIKVAQLKFIKIFALGLCFSMLGDFFLDYDRINWFIFGLGSFLIAHIIYIIALTPLSIEVIKKRGGIIIAYLVYGFSIFSIISSNLNELFIPVLIYMSILLFMALATLNSKKSNYWLLIGGLSFVLSDSLLGINKFYMPINNADFFIMLSYYFAQYALVQGMFLAQQTQPNKC